MEECNYRSKMTASSKKHASKEIKRNAKEETR